MGKFEKAAQDGGLEPLRFPDSSSVVRFKGDPLKFTVETYRPALRGGRPHAVSRRRQPPRPDGLSQSDYGSPTYNQETSQPEKADQERN
jgi:hypothetical protein